MLKRFKKAQQPRCYASGQLFASFFRWADLPEVRGKKLKNLPEVRVKKLKSDNINVMP